MIKLITYTDDRMTISAKLCVMSAIEQGADQVRMYSPKDLTHDFKTKMAHVLQHERGAGFYCWKPFVCHLALQDMKEGDYLIWSDAGTTWKQNLSLLTDAMGDESVLLFSNGWPHRDWCKMDTLDSMIIRERLDRKNILNGEAKQVQASHIVFKMNKKSILLIAEWADWSMRHGMIDNEPSILPNVPTFQEHRWDQAILTNLQIMHGLPLHWWPSNYGHHLPRLQPNDIYPAMFEHHRKRNNEW